MDLLKSINIFYDNINHNIMEDKMSDKLQDVKNKKLQPSPEQIEAVKGFF